MRLEPSEKGQPLTVIIAFADGGGGRPFFGGDWMLAAAGTTTRQEARAAQETDLPAPSQPANSPPKIKIKRLQQYR